MINNTNGPVIVVCDYRKIGVDSSFVVSDISSVDILITDTYSHPSVIKKFEDQGVTVIQVEPQTLMLNKALQILRMKRKI